MQKEEMVKFPFVECLSYFGVAILCIGIFAVVTNLIV
ncbi:hypothetical protein BACCIP111899_03075 [Bacillus rhizoplanae]|uniref:Uncharacterized protein n=1 Tax=Bacillus rhizoplanae TaxID=2880966 RepID=A0ABN8A2U5_9BACI|nr:hypothetical protein BACCIP111899_03075 [Bacillus rhizoplanae]